MAYDCLAHTSAFDVHVDPRLFCLYQPPSLKKKIKIKKIAVKNGLDGWREICIWTVNFKELQEVDFHSIKGLE